eukprot:5613073-Amphidinium_carterae.1
MSRRCRGNPTHIMSPRVAPSLARSGVPPSAVSPCGNRKGGRMHQTKGVCVVVGYPTCCRPVNRWADTYYCHLLSDGQPLHRGEDHWTCGSVMTNLLQATLANLLTQQILTSNGFTTYLISCWSSACKSSLGYSRGAGAVT